MIVALVVLLIVLAFVIGYRVCLYRAKPEELPGPTLPEWVLWLADAPMFIDERLVSAFYDAVLRPDYRTTSVQVSAETTYTSSAKVTYGGKLTSVIPGLELSGGGEVAESKSLKSGRAATLIPVSNGPRELTKVALHYVRHYADDAVLPGNRIWDDITNVPEPPEIISRPRMLACLDFPAGTMFIPVALETLTKVVPVHEKLVDKLTDRGAPTCPEYTDEQGQDGDRARAEYWQWFQDHWSATAALVTLEENSEGRPSWVNYRVPLAGGRLLHLNVVGNNQFDSGVFAYNLVKRGWRQGVRVFGTVRSEPGVNVLAIYDK